MCRQKSCSGLTGNFFLLRKWSHTQWIALWAYRHDALSFCVRFSSEKARLLGLDWIAKWVSVNQWYPLGPELHGDEARLYKLQSRARWGTILKISLPCAHIYLNDVSLPRGHLTAGEGEAKNNNATVGLYTEWLGQQTIIMNLHTQTYSCVAISTITTRFSWVSLHSLTTAVGTWGNCASLGQLANLEGRSYNSDSRFWWRRDQIGDLSVQVGFYTVTGTAGLMFHHINVSLYLASYRS